MKRIISILLTSSMLAGSAAMPFTAIASEITPVTTNTTSDVDDPIVKSAVVTVTIMEISSDDILVEPVGGSPELKSASKFSLSAKQLPADLNPKVGMKLEITYNGCILEAYPAMFGNVQKVVEVKEASEAAKTGTITVTVYNEDEGGLYTDELDITICGSSNVNIGSEMDGTIMLCGFDTSESNPFVLENFEINQDYRYNVIDISANNFDGYSYVMDYDRFDKALVFTDAADQKYDIYMKKQYYIVHSDTSISTDKYGEENIKNINEVDWLLRDLINSDTFKVRDMAKRQYLAKSMLMSLCEFKMIADWSFDEAENVMSFTYNCGMTGQLRPSIFKDEHKQLENVKLEDAEAVVRATILGIRDHEVIIKPVRGSWESWAVGSKLALSTGDFNNSNITPTLGMKLEITYNKGFLENSPAEFENVLKIKVLSEDGGLIKGDANCDEDVDMSDVVLIMQAMANPDRYGGIAPNYFGITELGKLNGDMNGDGLTVGDAQAIQKKLLGLDEAETELDITQKKISDFVDENKINCMVIPKDRIPENYADKYVFINNNYSNSDEKEALNKFILQNDIDRSLLKYIPYDLDDDHEVNKIVEKLYWYILDNDIKASVSRFAGSNDPKFEDKVVITYRWQDEGVEEKINAFLEENNVDPKLVIAPVLE